MRDGAEPGGHPTAARSGENDGAAAVGDVENAALDLDFVKRRQRPIPSGQRPLIDGFQMNAPDVFRLAPAESGPLRYVTF